MSPTKAETLLALHAGPGFVIPNAWDAGSAVVFERLGFPAIATTSAGIAWSLGSQVGGPMTAAENLHGIARIARAVDAPVSADIEDGYGDTPEEVGLTVEHLAEIGVVGANIEDAVDEVLYAEDEAAGRIAAARAAAPVGTFVLNARTDTYLTAPGEDPFDETVARALLYLEAGTRPFRR